MNRFWGLFSFDVLDALPAPESNPLAEAGVLDECQIVAVRFDAVRSQLSMLFEMRTALYDFGEHNVAVMLFDGVTQFGWRVEQRLTDRTAWTVLGSAPDWDDGHFELDLRLQPRGRCTVKSRSAWFVLGDVWSLDFIPDYGEDSDEVVDRNIPGWDSEFEVASSSRLP